MTDTLGQSAKPNSINVYLGEETKYIELPSKDGTAPKKFIIYPIKMKDIAKVESFTGIDFVEWESKNPFTKLSVMMFTLWLSICKNKELGYTQDEFEDIFGIPDMDQMFKLLAVVLKISGLDYVAKKAEEQTGKVEGAS